MSNNVGSTADKVRSVFAGIAVYKSAKRNKMFSSMGIPSYLRDWLLMRMADDEGQVDPDEVQQYVNQYIPRRDRWEALKAEMVHQGCVVRFLAKLRVELDIKSGLGLFSLPDLAFPRSKYDAVIDRRLLIGKKDELLSSPETWGVIDLEWRKEAMPGRPAEGRVSMVDFKPFQPYQVDLNFFREARQEFSLDEWVDLLLMGIDYNPLGFVTTTEKMTMLSRLLPFAERRVNLIELAPKGTGKTYVFSQLSKYGWLVSGGSISRARLFYDIARRAPGLIGRHDYVALDEIQSISFPDEAEVRGALKGYLESGEYRVGDYRGIGEASFVLLGNIDAESMSENANMFEKLPPALCESALIDRFHGFIKGWHIPRMRENLKSDGWGVNSEYLSEILHELRDDVRYRAVVDELVYVPKGADTRDTEAVKRVTTALLKLMFPQAISVDAVDHGQFETYCLTPALNMRAVIRKQLHIMDSEYTDSMPGIGTEV